MVKIVKTASLLIMTMYMSVTMMLTMPGRVNDDEDDVRMSMITMMMTMLMRMTIV